MSRLVIDSTSAKALDATNWPHKIGYYNGKISAWAPGDIARARATGQLLGLVDVAGDSPNQASVLDFERGDVQSPAVVSAWVKARNQMRGDAAVYVQPANIAHALSLLNGQKCNLWVVDLTDDGEIPFLVPHYAGMPPGVRVIGRQFALAPRSGGDYDLSIFYADDWHPDQADPSHFAAARLAAAPELGNYAVGAITAASPDGGAAAAAAANMVATDLSQPVPAAAAGFGMLGVQVPPDKLAAALSPGPVPLITTDEAADAGPGPVYLDTLGHVSAAVDPTAAAQAAAAAGPDQPGLNHEFIQHTLNDLHTVANMFHGAGVRNVAFELERVLGMAWDVGGIMKKAGL